MRFLDGRPVLAKPDTLAYRARRFVGRNRAAVAAVALFATSLVGFGIMAGWQARTAAAERDAARTERDKAEQVVGVLVDLFETSNPNVRPDGDQMSVRQFLVDAEPRVLDGLQTQPAVRARLQQVFGLIYVARDQYAEARRALEQALDAQRRLLGPDHPEAIESLYQLGRLAQHVDDEGRARTLFEEVFERSRRVFGEDHEKTARAVAALASPKRLGRGSGSLNGRSRSAVACSGPITRSLRRTCQNSLTTTACAAKMAEPASSTRKPSPPSAPPTNAAIPRRSTS